jgi:hypothetical protein
MNLSPFWATKTKKALTKRSLNRDLLSGLNGLSVKSPEMTLPSFQRFMVLIILNYILFLSNVNIKLPMKIILSKLSRLDIEELRE